MGNVTSLMAEIPLCQDNTGIPISKAYYINVMLGNYSMGMVLLPETVFAALGVQMDM